MVVTPILVGGGRGADQSHEKDLSFGEIHDIQSLWRAELLPFDIGQGWPVPGIEQAKHFATDPVCWFARAQPVRDTVADLDFINWTAEIRHGTSRLIV